MKAPWSANDVLTPAQATARLQISERELAAKSRGRRALIPCMRLGQRSRRYHWGTVCIALGGVSGRRGYRGKEGGMIETLPLPLDFADPAVPKDTRSWRQQKNDSAARHGYTRYNPRECKRIILSLVSAEAWTGSVEIFQATQMHPDFVGYLLEQMSRQGRLERHELYFIVRAPGELPHPDAKQADRLARPDRKHYAGFEWGWKLRRGGA